MSVVPRLVTRNWRLKLAAFGLAVFLWTVVRAEAGRTSQRTISSVPVLVEVSDLDWTIAGPPQPAVVDVRVGGMFGTFAAVGTDLRVRVPVAEVISGDTLIQLQRDWVVSDSREGIQVVTINPPRVRVRFEPTRRVAVPLSLRTSGSLPEDLALAQPLNLNPGVVRVQGPSSRIQQLDSIPVSPLDLSSVGGSRAYILPLDTTGFGDLSFETSEARVEVRVEEAVEQVMAGIPVVLDSIVEPGDTAGLELDPSTLQVRLRGGRNRVAAADADELRVVISRDLAAAVPAGGARMAPVRLRGVPDLVSAYSASDSVMVRRVPPDDVPDAADAAPDTTGTAPDTMRTAPDATAAAAPDTAGTPPDATPAAPDATPAPPDTTPAAADGDP